MRFIGNSNGNWGGKVDCEIERAARFYYLIKNSFGSGITTGWGFSRVKPVRSLWRPDLIVEVKKRLESVYIENRSFENLIRVYDSPDTLFYLDPPYWEVGDRLYLCRFKEADHIRLREVVNGIRGKWIMSYNDHPRIRKLYNGFKIQTTKRVRYSLNNQNGRLRHKTEILIKNF